MKKVKKKREEKKTKTRTMEQQTKHVCVKVVLLGEPSVGKTCTAIKYVKNTFVERYDVTIGANFFAKEM